RRDSIEQFRNAGRTDLVDKETAELGVLEQYAPPVVSAADLEQAVDAAIADTKATSPKDMGRVMKAVMGALAGKTVDGKAVNELVRKKLGSCPIRAANFFRRQPSNEIERQRTSLSSILHGAPVARRGSFFAFWRRLPLLQS